MKEHDYSSFISQQMKERKEFNYPPYNRLISITLKSTGNCKIQKTVYVSDITEEEYINIKLKQIVTGCIWRHLTNIQLYNSYYGVTEPYIIEYRQHWNFINHAQWCV